MKTFTLAFALVLSWATAISCHSARADEIYTFVVKKQEEKQSTRWTLAEWLKTRDRMKLMDLWLALHSPTPYEFYLGGSTAFGDKLAGGHYTAWKAEAAAFASIFGLSFQREFTPISRTLALFNLRIFGYNDQATNITLEAGLRSQSRPTSFRSAAGGARMSIYIGKFFGIDGLWRHYFGAAPNALGQSFSGNRFEGGAFIEYKFLRIYGKYFTENVQANSGSEWGARLYF